MQIQQIPNAEIYQKITIDCGTGDYYVRHIMFGSKMHQIFQMFQIFNALVCVTVFDLNFEYNFEYERRADKLVQNGHSNLLKI